MSEKRTMLHAWHCRNSGKMVPFGGWEMPVQYATGIIAEHLATRRCGGLFDVSHMGRFAIAGKQKMQFMQTFLTNNAAALQVFEAQYTMIQNSNGGAVDDAYLYRIGEEEYLLVVNAANAEKDLEWFRSNNSFDVTLEDKTGPIGMLALQGPNSKAVLEKLITGNLPEPARNHLSRVRMQGCNITLSRTGYTGEPICFELFVPAEKAPEIWEAILHTGKNLGIVAVGLGARDTLRLEAGLPLYGHELGMDTEGKEIPIFALPLAKFAVSFAESKGNFIGRLALRRQFEELRSLELGKLKIPGERLVVPRKIMPFELLDKGVIREKSQVRSQGKSIGYVTSGGVAPYWKFKGEGLEGEITDEQGIRSIGLACVDVFTREDQYAEFFCRDKWLKGVLVRRNLGPEAPSLARPMHFTPAAAERRHRSFELEENATKWAAEAAANTVWRQKETMNLIPSEQSPSTLVRLFTIMDPIGRYAEHKVVKALGQKNVYYYQGTKFIEQVEAALKDELRKYLGSPEVETRLVSGQMANTTVFSALISFFNRMDPKVERARLRKVMNHHIGKGGHLSSQPMGALKDFIAMDKVTERPAVVNFPVRQDNPYRIDMQRALKLIEEHQPELIIFGKSMVIHKEPIREIASFVKSWNMRPIIMYDMAHVLGLLGPSFQQPFEEGADIVTGSTHKTFFGTQRGIIAANPKPEDARLWEEIERRSFPGAVSNHHLGTLLGMLMAAFEMNAFAKEYQPKVIENAKAFARSLAGYGVKVEGDASIDFTETHQVLLRVGYRLGPEMGERLEQNNIIVNYQALPDDEGFSCSSGLRMGVQEMTRFGMGKDAFDALAKLMARVILKNENVRDEVARLRADFTRMKFCLDGSKAKALAEELLQAVMVQ